MTENPNQAELLKREKNIVYELETFSSFCANQLYNRLKLMVEFNMDEEDEKKQSFSIHATFTFSKKELFAYQKHFAKLDGYLKPKLAQILGACYHYHSWSVIEKELPSKKQRTEYAAAVEFNNSHVTRKVTVFCTLVDSFRATRLTIKTSISLFLLSFIRDVLQNYHNYFLNPGETFTYRCNLLRFDYYLDTFFHSSSKPKRGNDLPDYVISFLSNLVKELPQITEFEIKKEVLSFSTNIIAAPRLKKRKVEESTEIIKDEN
jgi:hypothetical protein